MPKAGKKEYLRASCHFSITLGDKERRIATVGAAL